MACPVAVTSAAGGGWSRPTRLTARGQSSAYPQVAFDRRGDALAVWDQERGSTSSYVVMFSERARGRSWTRPIGLSPPRADSEQPQVALTPSGAAAIVWDNSSRKATRASFVEAVSRAAWSAPWRRPVRVSPAGVEADFPGVGVDAGGRATAIWTTARRGSNRVQVSSAATSRGTWTPPATLAASPRSLLWPQIALDSRGDTVAAWLCCSRGSVLRTGLHHIVVSASRPVGSHSWRPSVRLGTEYEPPGQGVGGSLEFPAPHVAIAAHGAAVAVWQHRDGARVVVDAAFEAPGGRWSAPRPISSGEALEPHVGLDARGDATVIWQGANESVLTATRSASGRRWSQPHELARPEPSFDRYAHVAVSAGGEAIATWSGNWVQAAVRRTSLGRWSTPVRLGGGLFSVPGIDQLGQGLVLWQQPERHPLGMLIEASQWR